MGGTGDWDFLTLKKDTDARRYASERDGDRATGITVGASGNVYVAGASNNGVDG